MAPPAAAPAGNFGLLVPLDNGRELTSVALMYKEESMHQFDRLVRLHPVTVACFGQITGTTPNFTGMFPNMFLSGPGQLGALSVMPFQAMAQQATRLARLVYVGGLSPPANEQPVATFFSRAMSAIGGNTAGPGDAVVNVYKNHEKSFAFVETRSVEEASNAMALDGIIFESAQEQIALQLMIQPGGLATKVVCLTQVVDPDELKDDEDYEDIQEGTLVNVVIPHPNPNGEPTPGVGKVFLEYADTEGAL